MPKEKEKEFLTPEEAASYIGVRRATLYNYMRDLGIQATKMGPDKRRSYLALADVKRMKAYKEEPWTVETGKQRETDKSPTTLKQFRAPSPDVNS